MATAALARGSTRGPDELATRLFETHGAMLLRHCRTRLRSESEAEDAVQTTFVYALRALRSGVVPENEEAWLTSLATKVCHWQRRTDARRRAHGGIDLDAVADSRSAPGRHDELIGLEEALAAIPERQRRALVLREWHGVPPSEIAHRLGLTSTATHALLTRARASLALALTVARQPALALFWLAGELRSLVKALLGSATAKAGVAAVTVVATTGLTAGLVDKPSPPDRAGRTATIVADPGPTTAVARPDRSREVSAPSTSGQAASRSAPVRSNRPSTATKGKRNAASPASPVRSRASDTTLRPTPPQVGGQADGGQPAAEALRLPSLSPEVPTPPTVPITPVPDLPTPAVPTVTPPVVVEPTPVPEAVPFVGATVDEVVDKAQQTTGVGLP